MSGDRYEITDEGDVISVTSPGGAAEPWDQVVPYALRQQMHDIAELRAELQLCCELKREYQEREAAAVAERDEARQLYAKMADERDVAEARLAAIDAAPTVAIVESTPRGSVVRFADNWVPFIGTELIARPAKEES